MALKIRMSRGGRTNLPFYRIVVTDSRNPRDGRYIERVGTYNPLLSHDNENRVTLVKDRIEHWLKIGAKPSERVAIFLGKAGMIEMPKPANRPNKSAPSEKTKMRVEEKAKKRADAAEAAVKAEEEAKAAKEAAAAAPPAEEPKAEEAAPAEAAPEAPAAEEAKAE
jgi:small subunit ribosomal protein S16